MIVQATTLATELRRRRVGRPALLAATLILGFPLLRVALDAARRPDPMARSRMWVARLEGQGVTVDTFAARTNPDRTIYVEAAFRAGRGR